MEFVLRRPRQDWSPTISPGKAIVHSLREFRPSEVAAWARDSKVFRPEVAFEQNRPFAIALVPRHGQLPSRQEYVDLQRAGVFVVEEPPGFAEATNDSIRVQLLERWFNSLPRPTPPSPEKIIAKDTERPLTEQQLEALRWLLSGASKR
jgi:hypothetical protein